MSASAFSAALVALGIPGTVEERGKLAVIVPVGGPTLDAETRRAVVLLGRRHGFTNVCVEIPPTDAALSGD
jgi:hypothetical protein